MSQRNRESAEGIGVYVFRFLTIGQAVLISSLQQGPTLNGASSYWWNLLVRAEQSRYQFVVGYQLEVVPIQVVSKHGDTEYESKGVLL